MLPARIRGFDGVRAIAFLLVFVSHKLPTATTDRFGSLAVWLFFVLSGFLITRILAGLRTRTEAGTVSRYEALLDFYRSRAFRIFPPYYVVLAVLIILAAAGHYDLGARGRELSNLLFYSNVYIERHGWSGELGHFWSLAVEQQYYLLFAPLMLLLPQSRIPALCVGLLIASIAATILLLAQGAPQITFDVNSFVNMGLFGIGGLAGLFAERPLPRWVSNDVATVAAFGLLLSLPLFLPNPQFLETSRIAAGLLAACLLMQIAQRQQSGIVGVLEFAPVRWLGTISYTAYLIHPVIHANVLLGLIGIDLVLAHRWIMAMDLAITIALASASWFILEAPALHFARRYKLIRPAMRQPRELPDAEVKAPSPT